MLSWLEMQLRMVAFRCVLPAIWGVTRYPSELPSPGLVKAKVDLQVP